MRIERFLILFLIMLLFIAPAAADNKDGAMIRPAFYNVKTGGSSSLSFPGRAGTISGTGRSVLLPETIKSAAPAWKIFGSDDRKNIYFSPDNLPYCAVARVQSDYGTCSGFMIGPHYAVTSASCIYDKYQKFTDKVHVCPAYANGQSSCGCAYASYMWVMDTDLKMEYDVAVLKFDTTLGRCSGWLGYKQLSDSSTYDWATLIGYDTDTNMRYMFYTSGYLKGPYSNGNMLQYDFDTKKGSIGAPVVMGNEYVVAVDFGYNSNHNLGVRLTNKVMNFLKPYWGK